MMKAARTRSLPLFVSPLHTQRLLTTFLKGEDLSYGAFKRAWAGLDMGLVHFAAPAFTDQRLYLQLLYGIALCLLAPTLRLPGGRIQLPTSLGWRVRLYVSVRPLCWLDGSIPPSTCSPYSHPYPKPTRSASSIWCTPSTARSRTRSESPSA